jgi:hypothetical protein
LRDIQDDAGPAKELYSASSFLISFSRS